MRKDKATLAALASWIVLSLGLVAVPALAQDRGGAAGLSAFSSDAELRQFLKRVRPAGRAPTVPVFEAMPAPPPVAQPAPAVPASAEGVVARQKRVATPLAEIAPGQPASQPSITNNQVADVDEGGIVKVHGDNLVILRRGRLFTVSTAEGSLRPVDAINAYPKGVNPDRAWYDEMLVSRDRVIVIGYSYAGRGTEINRFRISPEGRLTYEDTHHLRSDDYYSSRNFASRLIGDRLIFYTPLNLSWRGDPLTALPAMRRWRGSDRGAFTPIVTSRHVYIAPELRRHADEADTLHTVTECDMSTAQMRCKATVVLGSDSRSFYVSGKAVYLWVSEYWREAKGSPEASLYRMPLDGSRPQAVQVRGTPRDQFSFDEDLEKGFLNVAVLSYGGGDAMWRPEFADGVLALLHLPLTSFGDGSREASKWDYRLLPQIPDVDQNRFVGDYLVYGGAARADELASWRGRVAVANLQTWETEIFDLREPVSRIEEVGQDALVVSSRADLTLTTVALNGRPRLSDSVTVTGGAEGESRSHGFFFRPDNGDGSTGVLGLAMRRPSSDDYAAKRPEWLPYGESSVDMLFMRRSQGRLARLGVLASNPAGRADDRCVASCVDWYGNARPIFLRGRVFALLGYELVEGREDDAGIQEVGRVNFAPTGRRDKAARRHLPQSSGSLKTPPCRSPPPS